MSEPTVDDLLSVLGNATRRRILGMLARERNYPLQLSRQLRVSQQSISKHLQVLEDNNLVACVIESTPGGPPHKTYVATNRFSLYINMAPHLFHADIYKLDESVQEDFDEVQELYNELEALDNPTEMVKLIAEHVNQINDEIHAIEEKHTRLMRIKNRMLREADDVIRAAYRDYNKRRILKYMVEGGDISSEDLSEYMDMRVKRINELLLDIFPEMEELKEDDTKEE